MTALKTKGLKLTCSNGNSETKFIYKGKTWTPYQFCVDHGKYYEIAAWDYYIRVDKATMKVTSNARNVDVFQPHPSIKAEIVKLHSVST